MSTVDDIVAATRAAAPIVADMSLSFEEKVARLVALGFSSASAGEMIAAAAGGLSGVDSDGNAWRA